MPVAGLMLLVLTLSALAEERISGPVEAGLVRVIDGDTIEVRAHLWLGLQLTTRVRLSDINAPELDGTCPAERELAKLARDFLALNLSPTLVLLDIRHDKYRGRVVARVMNVKGQDLGRLLAEKQLAIALSAPATWCQ